jgi:hypothetical protein
MNIGNEPLSQQCIYLEAQNLFIFAIGLALYVVLSVVFFVRVELFVWFVFSVSFDTHYSLNS